jgi:hypothetical protein
MKRVIHIGDGKHIEIEEGALRLPPLVPKPKRRSWFKPVTIPLKPRAYTVNGGPKKKIAEVPGYKEWLSRRKSETYRFSTTLGRRLGQQFGVTRAETERLWVDARKQAKKDMEIIKKAGINIDDAGTEALTTTLEIMRGPGDVRTKLSAARQVLEWTKAKPASESKVTLNTAEEWLATLAKEENGDEETDGGGA